MNSPEPPRIEPFDRAAISQIEGLRSLTLWRVGPHAQGPGREPKEPIGAVAVANDSGWAYSVDGAGRFDSSTLPGVSPEASERDAQETVVRIVEYATGLVVHATWTEVDQDTWNAEASFGD